MHIDDITYQIGGSLFELQGGARIVLDLPEGQLELYPAMSAGYCLRGSNERSERAATKLDDQ
jgi:hypothetical protein